MLGGNCVALGCDGVEAEHARQRFTPRGEWYKDGNLNDLLTARVTCLVRQHVAAAVDEDQSKNLQVSIERVFGQPDPDGNDAAGDPSLTVVSLTIRFGHSRSNSRRPHATSSSQQPIAATIRAAVIAVKNLGELKELPSHPACVRSDEHHDVMEVVRSAAQPGCVPGYMGAACQYACVASWERASQEMFPSAHVTALPRSRRSTTVVSKAASTITPANDARGVTAAEGTAALGGGRAGVRMPHPGGDQLRGFSWEDHEMDIHEREARRKWALRGEVNHMAHRYYGENPARDRHFLSLSVSGCTSHCRGRFLETEPRIHFFSCTKVSCLPAALRICPSA